MENNARDPWVKRAAIAAIVYTGFTFIIMAASLFQGYIVLDQEIRQLRAYVHIFPVTLTVFTPDKPFGFLLSITNHGQTPMREAYAEFGFDVVPENDDRDYTD